MSASPPSRRSLLPLSPPLERGFRKLRAAKKQAPLGTGRKRRPSAGSFSSHTYGSLEGEAAAQSQARSLGNSERGPEANHEPQEPYSLHGDSHPQAPHFPPTTHHVWVPRPSPRSHTSTRKSPQHPPDTHTQALVCCLQPWRRHILALKRASPTMKAPPRGCQAGPSWAGGPKPSDIYPQLGPTRLDQIPSAVVVGG